MKPCFRSHSNTFSYLATYFNSHRSTAAATTTITSFCFLWVAFFPAFISVGWLHPKRSFGHNGSRFSLQAGWWSSYHESTLSKSWKKIIHAHPQTTCHFHINLHYLVAPWSTDVMCANFCMPDALPANDSLGNACGSNRIITYRKLYLAGGYIQTLKGVQYVKWHSCLDNDSG